MGGLFSKPKAVKPPEVPAPQALPDTNTGADDSAAKQVRKTSGYEKQILAGSLAPQKKGLKTTLG